MRLPRTLALVLPLAGAAVFARLGVWQLARLQERRAFNATLALRLSAPSADVASLPADTGEGHYRRVRASGVLLYDREVAWAGRSRQGSPGVNLLTPLARVGTDTVVLVNRGWVYSPDAKTVAGGRWRERDSATVSGYAATFQAGRPEVPVERREGSAAGAPLHVVHTLDRAAVERLVARPVAPYLLVQVSDSASASPRDSVPVRLELPTLDEGPHRSYAVQWFSFAAIALVGGVVLVRKQKAEGG